MDKKEIDDILCFDCQNHLIKEDFGEWRYLWYNRHCKTAPKLISEILEEKEYEKNHLDAWCKSTNNGALCSVPYTTTAFPSRHPYEDYEFCCDVKKCHFSPAPKLSNWFKRIFC